MPAIKARPFMDSVMDRIVALRRIYVKL